MVTILSIGNFCYNSNKVVKLIMIYHDKRDRGVVKPRNMRLSDACWEWLQDMCYEHRIPSRVEFLEQLAEGQYEIIEKELK
jgi:hypothetical protein